MRGILLTLFLVFWSGKAAAHAVILNSFPSLNQQIPGSDLAIEIRFSSRIDASRSRLTLVKPDGGGNVILPLNDTPSADTLKAKVTNLPPGLYRLHWQTLSPDGHITQGDIPFSVRR